MNKIIVITGGTSGIGKYLAHKFSKNNFVYILSRNMDDITKKELKSDNIRFIKCDITVDDEMFKAFETIKNNHNHID